MTDLVLMRGPLGLALRRRRLELGRTLRQVSQDARVSLGYLSEVERGQKEASSELLASICAALDCRLSELLRDVVLEIERIEIPVLPLHSELTPVDSVVRFEPSAPAAGTVVAAA